MIFGKKEGPRIEKTESTVVQVAPSYENAKIKEMENFGWNLQNRQEIHEEGDAYGGPSVFSDEYIIKTKEMRAGVECVKIPDNVSYEKSVMVSLAAVAFKGMKRINIKKEDKVLIIGQGVIGLSALQLFKLKGVKVAVADLYESRLKISRKFADMTINTSKENLLDKVKEFTDGK